MVFVVLMKYKHVLDDACSSNVNKLITSGREMPKFINNYISSNECLEITCSYVPVDNIEVVRFGL